MERSKNASDTIRPFLEAMERSIDDVRRKRRQESGQIETPLSAASKPGPTTSPGGHGPTREHHTTDSTPTLAAKNTEHPETESPETPPVRLKARPKRPSAFTSSTYDQDNYRSQAG